MGRWSKAVHTFLREAGRKGGVARAKALTPERRREIAKLAQQAYRRKKAAKPPEE